MVAALDNMDAGWRRHALTHFLKDLQRTEMVARPINEQGGLRLLRPKPKRSPLMVDDAEKFDARSCDAYTSYSKSRSKQDKNAGFQRRELSGQTEIHG